MPTLAPPPAGPSSVGRGVTLSADL